MNVKEAIEIVETRILQDEYFRTKLTTAELLALNTLIKSHATQSVEREKRMKTPTPREILEELCGYQWDCLDARVSVKEDEWGGREYIDEALSALRELVLRKKKKPRDLDYINGEDYYNEGIDDIANLFGGEK